MSYCRFSCDDFQCDVYVYADVAGGWTTHVANRRHDRGGLQFPEPVPFDEAHIEAWLERYHEVGRLLERCPLVPIGLEYDGATFSDPTPGACADRLEQLEKAGYRVPASAIEQLRAESRGDASVPS